MQTAILRSGGRVIARVEIAGTFWQKARGLIGRSGLEPGRGMCLTRCRCIHTFGMRFHLDIAFLGPGGRVVRLARDVSPNRVVWGGWRAAETVEMAAGWLDQEALEPGAEISLEVEPQIPERE